MTRTQEPPLDLSLPWKGGDEIRKCRSSDYNTDGDVALVCCPFDFSPVCTDALCGFRDAEWLTFFHTVEMVGISRDSCHAHKRFVQDDGSPFPLQSDTEGGVIEEFDLETDDWELHSGVQKRALLTIDESHNIPYKRQTEDADIGPDFHQLGRSGISMVTGQGT